MRLPELGRDQPETHKIDLVFHYILFWFCAGLVRVGRILEPWTPLTVNFLCVPAAKKVDLTDVGIVGGLSAGPEEKDKGIPNSLFMGRAMGTGSGLGKSTGFTTSTTTDMDDFFSSLSGSQNQYGAFQK